MKTAILNVSLDQAVNNGPIQRRFDVVMARMRLCFHGAVGEIAHVDYVGPDGPTQEACAVVTLEYNASHSVFEDAVHALSRAMGQDCIAVLFDDGYGQCIGPKAHLWPFNPRHFSLPSIFKVVVA